MEGLDRLQKLVKTLKTLPKEVAKSVDVAIVNHSAELLQVNRDQIRKRGEDSEGNALKYKRKRVTPVGNVYTKQYERFKNKAGKNTAYVDLTFSGNFLNSMRLDHLRLGRFRIYSETTGFDLQKELEWNYGKDIFGLQDVNLQKYLDENITPFVEFEVQQILIRI